MFQTDSNVTYFEKHYRENLNPDNYTDYMGNGTIYYGGAGCGKTYKLCQLASEAEDPIILSFTNKATENVKSKNNIQIGYYNRENIPRIFKLIDRVSPEVNDIGRKRLISVNFIIKQLFDILGIEYKFIPLTRSKTTLKYCSQWWEKVYALIKDDIN